MTPFDSDEAVGRVLGDRYRVVAPVGAGASARVYVADDVVLRRRVAVKVLHEASARDAEFLRRFRTEAQAAASLNHANVLGVYDWGLDEVPYLVSEYLAGGSLRSLLDTVGVLSPGQGLLVALETARGLDHAHTRGLLHRSIKPANLLFGSDRRLRIADFGVARALAEAGWTEPAQSAAGTLRYGAPEQAVGEPLGPASDVYSLALVINEAVSGELPFVAETPADTLTARARKPLEPHPALGPIQGIVRRAGALDPGERPTASQLVTELTIAAGGMARPDPLPLAPPPFEAEPPASDRARPQGSTERLEQQAAAAHQGRRPGADRRDPAPGRGTTAAGGAADEDNRPGAEREGSPPRWLALILTLAVLGAAVVGGAVLWRQSRPVARPVPNLVGMSFSEAQAAVAEFGWPLETIAVRRDGTVADEVVAGDPGAGVELAAGETLRLEVSLGEVLAPVPDLAGLTLAEAEARLSASRLGVGDVEFVDSEEVPEGTVVEVLGAVGVTEVEPGSDVDLRVSAGPADSTAPPDPQSRSLSEAEERRSPP